MHRLPSGSGELERVVLGGVLAGLRCWCRDFPGTKIKREGVTGVAPVYAGCWGIPSLPPSGKKNVLIVGAKPRTKLFD